jgi:hypothetical protein
MLVTSSSHLYGPRLIIHFPTKRHWRQPSQLAWVRDGLQDLARVIRSEGISSIAIPPLGCGNGGLNWADVRPEIEAALSGLDADIVVFEPTTAYFSAPKRAGVEALTPARALVSEMVRRYSVLGLECSILEIQKLAWFLDRCRKRSDMPDALRLTFVAERYGPYADQLRHLLDQLDGSYLHCERRLGDAKPLDVVWFDEERAHAVTAFLDSADAASWRPVLAEATRLIEGFESPLGMELLATVDWLVTERGAEPTVDGIRTALRAWPAGQAAAERKLRMFDEQLIQLALTRLHDLAFV